MAKIDIGSKQTIHLYSKAWLEWLLEQPVTVQAELSSEFRFIARLTDSLLRVKIGRQKPFLALTELQWKYQKEMPERLMAYGALARQKYKLDVFLTVVYLTPPTKAEQETLPTTCHHEFRGQVAHQDFQVISLWELDAKEILVLNNPALLPFLPLMKGGQTRSILRACVKRIRQQPSAQAEELENFLAALASYVFDIKWLRQLLRWNMELIKESPLFQELVAGERQQIEQLQGELSQERRQFAQERLENLSNILRLRFGKLPKIFPKRVDHWEVKVFKRLNQAALKVKTLAEFEELLTKAQAKK